MARVTRQVQALYALCAAAIVEGRANLDGADEVGFDIVLPVFSVGRAAELAGIHSQTLRQYDRQGVVVPQRTEGGARRYSLRDVSRLAEAHHLSQGEGISLVGVIRILDLEEENRQLRREVHRLNRPSGSSVFAADRDGGITEMQRSRQARRWRHDIHSRVRELPYRPYDPETDGSESDGYGLTGGQTADRGHRGARDSGSSASFASGRALVLYGEEFSE
ncbi:MerR family transcriptional regulator, heat shock protein HspR [Bifidobacterium bohemicum]|uniref:Transcriptional regulator, MerR family n=1 Tax=Bifidobacterium bohemicum DSM 22767 TaxID=1437606 RepID=A0A086ZHC5_9BIFI|nr:MerR family transcriptional regulator [Bifidobacterium bohemicum]KFI45925.1 transcriptional regulator, MerR family [Bifidobacterium bohemicum DSM 22767]SCC14919.1 MerR family transcriptional regulator, heat shock protein HspR [Bifidobacterium bohemicum]